MHRLNLKGDKALSFIAGLLYGYSRAQMELRVLSFEEFEPHNHKQDRVYYFNRKKGELCEGITEEVSHICVVREDTESGKVCLFIYKKSDFPRTPSKT